MYSKVKNLLKNKVLTVNEERTLQTIMKYLNDWEPVSEPGYSDLEAVEVAKLLKEPIESVRGYVGSLVKKGFIEVTPYEIFDLDLLKHFDYQIIYLTDKTRALY